MRDHRKLKAFELADALVKLRPEARGSRFKIPQASSLKPQTSSLKPQAS
jgi:hypothetical protein